MSVVITIDLSNISRPEVLAVRKLLTDFDTLAMQERISAGDFTDETIQEAALREATRRPIPSQLPVSVDIPVNDPATDAAMDLVPEAPAKAKRGRPKKEAAVEQVDPTSAPSAAASTTTTTTTAACGDEPKTGASSTESATPSTVATPTPEEIRSALLRFTEKHDANEGLALLKRFGCVRVSELLQLPVEKHVEFVAACNA